jgi:RNA polymerase sigma factor for flagellar operon FliA
MQTKTHAPKPNGLLNDHMPLARQIAARLKRRYTWVQMDDLYSYSLLGLTMAANAWDSNRGVPFPNFASQKGMFWAIDEMRKDGVLRRRSSANMPRVLPFSEAAGNTDPSEGWTPEVMDAQAEDTKAKLEARDLCATLLKHLRAEDRQLLMMYYAQHMTFREIADVFGISESSVCLRHKALIRRLKRLADSSQRVA